MMKRAKDIENMTIAEYMEYEAKLKKQSRRSTRLSHLKRYEGMDLNFSHREKNIALEYPHYSDDAKIDAYYDLPTLLPCFQHVQPHTNYDQKPPFADVKSVTDSMATYESDRDYKGQDKCAKETVSEWFKTEIKKHKRIQQKKDRSPVSECRVIYANNDFPTDKTLFDETNELHEASSTASLEDAHDEEDVPSKILPCQLPPKELNPWSFTLPCTIRSLNFYAMADLEARIVENVLVRIDKFLFPSDFVVIDMLEVRNETMILRRPFLATIYAEINVFNKEISLGVGEDRISFDMNKKIHNFTTPGNCNLHNQNNNTPDNDGKERCGKKARIDETDPTTPKVHICIYGIDEKGKLREWYCHHDDKRIGMTGEGLSFLDFLLVKYEGSQGSDLIWDNGYAEWCDENSISNPSTSKLNTARLDSKAKPRDYTFKEWMLIKVGHTNVNESEKRTLLKS
ncbi:hypothetical protein Tco_0406977 [Tanacetum coccineum]